MPAYTFTVYIFSKHVPTHCTPYFFMQQSKKPNPALAAPKTYSRRRTRSTAAADAAASDVGQEQATTKHAGGGRLKKKVMRKVPKQRSVRRLSKEQQTICASYEEWLERQKEEAQEELAILQRTITGEAGTSGGASQPIFPDDPVEDINCLTPPLRLSPEECEQGSQDFDGFQKIVFRHLGHSLRKWPRQFISPFLIAKKRAAVPLSKALTMRNKILSDEKLRQ
jgi:hypothetical protein